MPKFFVNKKNLALENLGFRECEMPTRIPSVIVNQKITSAGNSRF